MNYESKIINYKLMIKNKRYKIIFFTFLFFILYSLLFFIPKTLAAELYLETSKNEYYLNETFIIDVSIDVYNNESINAVEVYLKFPNNILEVKDFSTGNSILTFIENPKINQEQGLISFTGIIPGGYSGRIPGDPGKSNLLGKIIFYSISEGSVEIVFQNNSQALLGDGKGTLAKLSTGGIIIEVQPPQEIEPLKDEWQEQLVKDKIPPEDFKPEIVKINNKYYLAFTTKDKNSGIDHYDVLEKPQAKSLLRSIIAKWVKANSPYLLKDQSLSSNIEVRAVDKAGNERIVKLQDTYFLSWYNYCIWIIIILVILSYLYFKLWPYLKTKQH